MTSMMVMMIVVVMANGVVVAFGGFRELRSFEDMNLGGRDAAAIDLLDFEGCAEIKGGGGFVKDLGIDASVYERAEEHVSADTGEAVEIGDAHGVIVSRLPKKRLRCEAK